MDYINLGVKIRQERNRLSMTQSELSEKCNVTPSFIGLIERGERKLSLETLVSISNALSVSVDYLLRDSLDVNTDAIISEINVMLKGKDRKILALSADLLKSLIDHLGD